MSVSPNSPSPPDLKVLRDAIPPKCFQPSLPRSFFYLLRDLFFMLMLFILGLKIAQVADVTTRFCLWSTYGFLQGLVVTGIWVLAHECGHDAFSTNRTINMLCGFVMHSFLLVPFFSWKFTHARHHRYVNHMERDTVFVPSRKKEAWLHVRVKGLLKHAEDSPIFNVALLVGHQLFGWPLYIFLNAGAGQKSLISLDRTKSLRQNHLDPWADIFATSEIPYILLSDLGLFLSLASLYQLSCRVGGLKFALLYGLPYFWMNHWIVAITYLHHHHPRAYHYEDEAWSYHRGALSTVDRDFGFIGRHLFHGIIEFHMIHHLFPRIPFYHAEEATQAIVSLLGQTYIRDNSSFLYSLWHTFKTCKYVEDDQDYKGRMVWRRSK